VNPRSWNRREMNDGIGAGEALDCLSELRQICEQRRRDQIDRDNVMSMLLEIAGNSPAGLSARTGHGDLHSAEAYEEGGPRDVVARPRCPA
jgi:hypothetical protein